MINFNFLVICLMVLTLYSLPIYGSNQDSTEYKYSLGMSGGLAQHNTFSSDFYGGVSIPINSTYVEINFGYLYFESNTDYAEIQDLEFNSHGLFLEGNYYLIKGFYTGLRFAVNFNWVDKESQKKFDNLPNIDSPDFFLGRSLFGHVGYRFSLGNRFFLKFQGQIGLHNYKIAEGNFWQIGSDSNRPNQEIEEGIETKLHLLHNISLRLTYNLN